MVIAVTAPKKGLGQTTTAINIAAGLVKLMAEIKLSANILIIDINKYCRDIEYYLSNTTVTRGLDDFFSMYQSQLINDESFNTCVKRINDNLSIIGSNEYFEITPEAMDDLLKRADRLFDFVVIDSMGITNISGVQKAILERAKKVIITLNQTKSVTQALIGKEFYREEAEKIIYAVNRHLTTLESGVMHYTVPVIKQEFEELGINSAVYPLNFEVDIMNEGNYGSILSFVLGDKTNKYEYNRQLRDILKEIVRDDPRFAEIYKEKEEKRGFFGLRR